MKATSGSRYETTREDNDENSYHRLAGAVARASRKDAMGPPGRGALSADRGRDTSTNVDGRRGAPGSGAPARAHLGPAAYGGQRRSDVDGARHALGGAGRLRRSDGRDKADPGGPAFGNTPKETLSSHFAISVDELLGNQLTDTTTHPLLLHTDERAPQLG
jgi:hypothetical protein